MSIEADWLITPHKNICYHKKLKKILIMHIYIYTMARQRGARGASSPKNYFDCKNFYKKYDWLQNLSSLLEKKSAPPPKKILATQLYIYIYMFFNTKFCVWLVRQVNLEITLLRIFSSTFGSHPPKIYFFKLLFMEDMVLTAGGEKLLWQRKIWHLK